MNLNVKFLCFIALVCLAIQVAFEVSHAKAQGDRVPVLGGPSDEETANDDIKSLVRRCKGLIEAKTQKKYKTLEALRYRSQVVAGRNFYVKVRAVNEDGSASVLHVKIFRPIHNDNFIITQIRENVGHNDSIEFN